MTKVPITGKLHIWGTDANGDPFNDSVDILIEEVIVGKEKRYMIRFGSPGEEPQWLGSYQKEGIWLGVMNALSYAYRNCDVEQMNLSWFYEKENV